MSNDWKPGDRVPGINPTTNTKHLISLKNDKDYARKMKWQPSDESAPYSWLKPGKKK